jgi:SAM-dependent methyltransferase
VQLLPWRKPTSPPLPTPFSPQYAELHREFVTEALQAPGLINRFARSRGLPRGYGVGLDERVVEYPWVLAQRPGGRVLDAGSALNHAHILDRFLPIFADLHIVTLAPEAVAFTERGISYVYTDLRELPFRDASYDTIISISTLEHVGLDNERYGAAQSGPEDARTALRDAVDELRRVLAPGGVLLVTVPYGVAENHGWFRQFDREAIEELIQAIDPRKLALSVFAHSRLGWHVSSLEDAAHLRYQDSTSTGRGDDLAAAARAVVCLRAEK